MADERLSDKNDETCKGGYWSSMYQGPCWVCECCAEHGCKLTWKHCHRALDAAPQTTESASLGGCVQATAMPADGREGSDPRRSNVPAHSDPEPSAAAALDSSFGDVQSMSVPQGECLWLIETSELGKNSRDPAYPKRHFWTGTGWHFDALQAARYKEKYTAELIREKEQMYPTDKYPVCDHMFQCAAPQEGGGSRAGPAANGEPAAAARSAPSASRDQVIEECAKLCDTGVVESAQDYYVGSNAAFKIAAEHIRALKGSNIAPEGAFQIDRERLREQIRADPDIESSTSSPQREHQK